MIPTYDIHLLGDFHLLYHDEPVLLQQVRLQSLLAYLLMHRQTPQSRQHLAYLLWPDSTETQARTNLRRELHYLRRSLPEVDRFLHVDARTLQWCDDAPFRLDVADFEAAVDRVAQAEESEDDGLLRARLEEAVALYPGDLLPGCYDDWIATERERLSQLFAGQLEHLIQLLEQQRDYSQAIQYAERLRRYDPLHEATYRHLIRLHALNGDRARGLRIYHTCVTILKHELGVDPSPTTRALYERLIDADSSSIQSDVPTILVAEGRLVGRHTEWNAMQHAWHTTTKERAQVVLVSGEAGIGKSRLVEELVEWAKRQGIATAVVRCYAAEGQLAYAPVADWLRAESFQNALLTLDEIWLTEVARLLPTILVERPQLPRPAPMSDSGQRLRLFRALAQVVLAGKQPLLLVIDDLQWCDRESLEWLHFLLRSTPQRRLLLAGTARPEEVGPDHPLRSLLMDLRGTQQLSEIELSPLDAQATAELAALVSGRELDGDQSTQLYAESEGNPLFVIEMIRAGPATSDHSISRPRGEPHEYTVAAAPAPQPDALPPKIHAVLHARLAQLSPQARALADLAATIGRSFTFQVLAHAHPEESSDDAETLVRGLDELWQRRIIREQEEDAYDFSHDKIREVVYAEISRARQQLLHRRVAQALEAVYGANTDIANGQIAVHYERAGLLQPALRHYRRAAESAQRVYANQEAKAFYTRAIQASQRMVPAPDAGELLPIYEGRARICRSLAQLEEAIADLQVVRRLAREVGDRQKEGAILCQLAYTHWLTFSEEQVPFVEQYAQEAHDLFDQTDDQAIRARSLTLLGAVDQVHGNLTAAGRKLENALASCRHIGDNEALVQTLSFLCLQSHLQGDAQATVQFAQEGVQVARTVHDDFNELRILAFLCQGQWSAGNYARAFVLVQEAMSQAQSRGNTFIHSRMLNTLGWFHHELGDFSRAATYNQEGAELGRASGIHNVEISALINLGYDYLALGRAQQALACLQSTLARVEQEGFGAHKWRWQMKLCIGLAEHAFGAGDYAQALQHVEAGLEQATATSSHKYMAKGLALRGKILGQLGNTEAAGADLRSAHAIAERLQNPSLSYPLAHALGHWHETRGQYDEAAILYAKARSAVERMAAAVDDETLAALFLQSESVRQVAESWTRTF